MAEQLETFDFKKGTSRSVYQKWLDGKIWKIEWMKETDTLKLESFRASLYGAAAKEENLKVRTRVISETEIVVQAVPKNGD